LRGLTLHFFSRLATKIFSTDYTDYTDGHARRRARSARRCGGFADAGPVIQPYFIRVILKSVDDDDLWRQSL
jgi:hypothetical protein